MTRTLWLLAGVISLWFVMAEYVPGRFSSIYVETVGPLLASTWLAYVFRQWWQRHREAVLSLPPRTLAVFMTVLLTPLVLGGFRLLWVDFWLFAPILWPLIEIALALRARSQSSASEDAAFDLGVHTSTNDFAGGSEL